MENKSTISEHLLITYWKGEATEAEKQEVENWLASDLENRGLFDKWKLAWEHAGAMADFEAVDVAANWEAVRQKLPTQKKGKQVSLFPKVWRYAAAILLVATVGFLLLRKGTPEMMEVTAGLETKNVVLPDGSEVWLNQNASLRYPKRFTDNRRLVELSGEAFFEVTHNPAKPFSVMADGTETRVLGTSFNLKEQEGNRLELILVTGKVRFEREEDWEILSPGEKLTVDETGSISKEANSQRNFMSWRTKRLEFDSTAMADVILDVEELYGVNLEIESTTFGNCPLTTTFENDPLEDILSTFNILFDAEIEKTDQGYLIKGGGCQTQ